MRYATGKWIGFMGLWKTRNKRSVSKKCLFYEVEHSSTFLYEKTYIRHSTVNEKVLEIVFVIVRVHEKRCLERLCADAEERGDGRVYDALCKTGVLEHHVNLVFV